MSPEPRQPQDLEQADKPMDILNDLLECGLFTREECHNYRQRMGEALLWEAIETVHILDGKPEEPTPTPPPRMSRAQRRAALRRRKMLVNVLLLVALSTLLTSLYALGLGHDALGWFGLAGALGLAGLAHRAEEGR